MPPVIFVCSLCKIHVVLCSKIAYVHGIGVRTWNLFIFGKFSDFYCITAETYRGVGKGHNSSGAESLRGGKNHNNDQKHFFKTVYLLPKDRRFEHRGAKLVSCPRRYLTSLRPCTSRLSSQNGEICLRKCLPISGKLSITNYLKQNAVDYIEIIWP